jgi:hypothetical protein
LGALKVRIPRREDADGLLGPVQQNREEGRDGVCAFTERVLRPQSKRRGDLVVAGPPGVYFGSKRAEAFGQNAFYGGVDVLVPVFDQLGTIAHRLEFTYQP